MSFTWKEEAATSSPPGMQGRAGKHAFYDPYIYIYIANLTSHGWFSGLDISAEGLPV